MGRLLKRVPLDFDAPLDEIWRGYRVNAWRYEEPPVGAGFQLWEDTTEGSPVSPVFKTLEELCEWCETNATTFADIKVTKDEWYKMLYEARVYHKSGNIIFV